MKKITMVAVVIVTIIMFITPIIVARNPAEIDKSTFCNYNDIESSIWNVSEFIPGMTLLENWSALNDSSIYTRWNVSNNTNKPQNWYGGDTLLFDNSDGMETFSACFVNESKHNRSQSLLWTFVNSTDPNASFVYSGPIFYNTLNDNFTMVLHNNNSSVVFNYAYKGGKWGLFNTEDMLYDPNGHGGEVIIYSDAIRYNNTPEYGLCNLTDEKGAFIKTIYNTYCGRIQSKSWSGNNTLTQEPPGWIIDDTFTNATSDDEYVCFGVAFWIPTGYTISCNISYDYINNWRLNYSLNTSDTISWDAEFHPRPQMTFPVLNTMNVGKDMWELIMPTFAHGITGNITNDTISQRIQNLTNNMSMESRPFDVNLWADFDSYYAQNDTVYYYTSVLTNYSDWYISYLNDLGYSYPYDDLPMGCPNPDTFSNNYLAIFVQQCEDGDNYDAALGYDYTCVGIDIDNNRQWDDNDRFIATNTWSETYSWTGTEMDFEVHYTEDGLLMMNMSNCVGLSWLSEANAPHNIHRYSSHLQTLILVPLWSCVKSNGDTLDNGDVFGLHVASYNDRPGATCVWENWAEKNCSVFHNESDVDGIADLYMNDTNNFIEDFWSDPAGDCIDNCDIHCWKMHWDNYTQQMECFTECWEQCIRDCGLCHININNDNLKLWGEGKIPGSPKINDTEGRFAVNISIDLNISYLNESETGNPGDNTSINITFVVCNEGDMPVTDLQLNLTWLNCSCSDWKFWYVDSNITINNITFYNDSCYAIFNLSNMTGETCLDYWIIVNITECIPVVGDIWIEAEVNTSSGIGASDNDSTRLRWGLEAVSLTITGSRDTVDPFEISETVLFFSCLCIIISAILGLLAVVVRGGRIF